MKKWLTIIMLWACAACLWGRNASQTTFSRTCPLAETYQMTAAGQAGALAYQSWPKSDISRLLANVPLPQASSAEPQSDQSPAQATHSLPRDPHSSSILPDDGTNGEATLSNSSLLLQICQCRPANGPLGLHKAKSMALLWMGHHATLQLQNRWGEEISSPVRIMPQSRYYVYTLRRMRC